MSNQFEHYDQTQLLSSPILVWSSAMSFLLLVVFLMICPLRVVSEHDLHSLIISLPSSSGGSACARVSAPHSCPVNCFRADPVCGVDGVTYWCGCPDAACHGAHVAQLGPCEVANDGPAQALLLLHIVWLFLLAFAVLLGLF